jgi:ABC-type phosphate/phosphonate transport system substrate-binding protein
MIIASGIQVKPFVAGDLREVIQAWLSGNLEQDAFAMPGCCGHGRGRRIGGNGIRFYSTKYFFYRSPG